MRYFIYIMIGLGLTTAIEHKGKEMSFGEKFVTITMWPGVVAAVGFTLVMREMKA